MNSKPDLPSEIPAERLGRLVLENAQEFAILTADFEGAITGWTPGAARVFGYTAEEIIGESTEVLFTAADRAAGAHRQELEDVARQGRTEDSRWHIRKGGEWFWANGVSVRFEIPDRAGMLKILRDETRQKRAEDQRVLLLNELNHRIKNTLATVQSIAEQTLRFKQVDPSTREDLTNRLVALSEAHNVLVEENWAGADLEAVVRKTLEAHLNLGHGRFKIEGPAVRLSPAQSVSLSLTLHELATNAVKYGALSVDAGSVRIAWNLAQDAAGQRHMTLLWQEAGGPPVSAPARGGFGTSLIARTFSGQNGGRARIFYEPDGLCCVVELALPAGEGGRAMDLEAVKRQS